MIAIGKKIEEIFQEKGMKLSEFANRINRTPRSIYDIFKRDSIDTDLLFKISKALDHDFFNYYSFSDAKTPEVNEPIKKYIKTKGYKVFVNIEVTNKEDEERILRMILK